MFGQPLKTTKSPEADNFTGDEGDPIVLRIRVSPKPDAKRAAGGGDVSWDEVRARLKTLVEAEDKAKPLSDEELAALDSTLKRLNDAQAATLKALRQRATNSSSVSARRKGPCDDSTS